MQQAPRKTLRGKQAHAIYGVSTTTLYRLAAKGLLNPVKVGTRCTLWPVDQLDALFVKPQTTSTGLDGSGATKATPHADRDLLAGGAA